MSSALASRVPIGHSALGRTDTVASGRIGLPEAAVFCAWTAFTLALVWHHEMWRDEVRALSFAIDPPTIGAMLLGLRGEGHPALWYLILRVGYGLTGSMLVLPVAAFLASAAAVGLLLWRSPFSILVKVLLVASAFVAVEYTVLARNYGISMLPIFLFAARYDDWRYQGIRLGLILAVLANTNVHSIILVAALLGMWMLETVRENGLRWSRPLGVFVANAAIAGLGVVFAAWIVTGSGNDAISAALPMGDVSDALWAIINPGAPFWSLAPDVPAWLLSLLLFGVLLGFAGAPAQQLAALAALLVLSIFFVIGLPGFYRHAAIWLLLVVCLSWITEARRRREGGDRVAGWPLVGRLALAFLLAAQVAATVTMTVSAARFPSSNSKAVAATIQADPRLAGGIVLAEPDYLLEPLRYYGIDRTYLLREQRFGRTVNFTRTARLSLSLGDVLETAERLRRESGREVVILMGDQVRFDPAEEARRIRVGYNWTFSWTPRQVADFSKRTERVATFDSSLREEDYTVYRLR